MAVFEYSALTAKGKKTTGIVDADSVSAAREKLRRMKVFPVSLDRLDSKGEVGGQSGTKVPVAFNRLSRKIFSPVSSSDITLFTRQTSTLLSAGFPLVKAIATLVPQVKSKAFQRVLSRIKDAIEEGNSFAEALAAHTTVFSPVYVNMVRAGETSGTLEIVLERLADFSEKREDTRKKIQAAMAYPVFISIMGFFVLVFLLTYIVPGITKIFIDMNQALPLPTHILIETSSFLTAYWWAVVPAPVVLAAGLLAVRRTDRGGYMLDKIAISMPLVGNLIRKVIAARFSRTLGSLLENGVPMLAALGIAKTISGNRVVSSLVEKAAQAVEQGGSVGGVLEKSRAFPALATQMIKVGETSGEMERMLEKTADLFDRDVNSAVTAATSVIEPMIILIMGVVVGFIVLAICLPIFEINQLIR